MAVIAKIWSMPELVILSRSKPEEMVLVFCKGDGSLTSSAAQNDGCWLNATDSCNEISLS
jgi:hypothetical protein